MLVFGTSGQHANEDVGLTFPEDYGAIAGFQWLEDDTVHDLLHWIGARHG